MDTIYKRQLLLTGSQVSYMEIRSFRADLGSMRSRISCLLWTISLIVLKKMAFHTRGNCVPQHWSRERSSILEPCSKGHQRFLAPIPAFMVTLALGFALYVLLCGIAQESLCCRMALLLHVSLLADLACRHCSGADSRSFWHVELLKLLSARGIERQRLAGKAVEEKIVLKVS